MKQTLALDVYGTLIDTSGVLQLLEVYLHNQANSFSNLWRNKQLEYSFRRGLMDRHVDFSVCTREALDYSCQHMEVVLSDLQKGELMALYKKLPAFPETREAIIDLKQAGHHVYAFSNGSYQAVEQLLQHADILSYFDGIVSMEAVKTFKPNPKGYAYFVEKTNTDKSKSWLVSGNSFDVIGALSYGMNAAWLQRNPSTVFDPMGFSPNLTIDSLTKLKQAIDKQLEA